MWLHVCVVATPKKQKQTKQLTKKTKKKVRHEFTEFYILGGIIVGMGTVWLTFYELKWLQSEDMESLKHMLNLNVRTFEEYSETDGPYKQPNITYNLLNSKSWFVRNRLKWGNERRVNTVLLLILLFILIWKGFIIFVKIENNNINYYQNLYFMTIFTNYDEWIWFVCVFGSGMFGGFLTQAMPIEVGKDFKKKKHKI